MTAPTGHITTLDDVRTDLLARLGLDDATSPGDLATAHESVEQFLATAPRHLVTNEGLPITSFRLASTQRRYDRGTQKWIDAETNWYTVTCFRQLATNAVTSIDKGQRIVVTGKLRVRDWQTGDRAGTTVEIDAEALGHDLAWGSSVFTRSVATTVSEFPAEAQGEPSGQAQAEVSSSRPAVLDDAAESTDELAEARSKRPLEVALPF
jgi:single-strand DNA-binding protein